MPQCTNQVRPDVHTKMDVSARLVAGWARIIARMGKGKFADALGVDTKLVSRALSGETVPELHTAFNSLAADPSALDELAALYGVEIRPRQATAAQDMATVAGLSHLVGLWVEALADGNRNHRETCQLAEVIRPLMHQMNAICAEADRHRLHAVGA